MALFRRRPTAWLTISGMSWRVPADLAAAVEKHVSELKETTSRVTVDAAALRGERDALAQLLADACAARTAERARAEDAERLLAVLAVEREEDMRATLGKLAPESLRATYVTKPAEELRGSVQAVVDVVAAGLAAEAATEKWIARNINVFGKPARA